MIMTLQQLQAIMPQAGSNAALFLDPLNQAMHEFSINTKQRMAAFLAQIAHESAQLTTLVENLNYSADGLVKTWPSRFSGGVAAQYARLPEKIANRVYAGRFGNGDEASGDGWRYRGAGAIQLTFKNNQEICGKYFNISPENVGAWLRTPVGACRSAGWFWSTHNLNNLADIGDFTGITRVINGGTTGLADREQFYAKSKAVLG